MCFPLLAIGVLVTVTVLVHATGFSLLLRSLMKSRAAPPTQTWPIVWRLISVTWWLILIHAAEISVWALCYLWAGCLPDAESAFYFSGVSYTTVGYGDLVLAEALADARPAGGFDRHSHVRIVRQPLLRLGQQNLRVACGSQAKMNPGKH